MINKYAILLLLMITASVSEAQYEGFKYKRSFHAAADNWSRIQLNGEITDKLSNDYSDIRLIQIIQADTIELPYFVQSLASESHSVDVPYTVFNQVQKDGYSYYTFHVKDAKAINEIELFFNIMNYDWKVVLEGSQDQKEWFTIVKDYRLVSIHNDYVSYSYNTLNVETVEYSYLRIAIPDVTKNLLNRVALKEYLVTQGSYHSYASSFKQIQNKNQKQTIVDVTLDHKVPVSEIALSVHKGFDYYRPLTISVVSDSIETANGLQYIYTPVLNGILSSLESGIFNLDNIMSKKIRIEISNQNNIPLNIDSVKVSGVHQQLVFRTLPGTAAYVLLYGNSGISKPSYDIEFFKKNIPDSLTQINIANEEIISEKHKEAVEPLFENKLWLWAILAVIVLAMGFFSIKMIRKTES